MSGIECELDIFGTGAGGLGIGFAVDRGDYVKVLPFEGGGPLAVDEVVVLGFVGNFGTSGTRSSVDHCFVSRVLIG